MVEGPSAPSGRPPASGPNEAGREYGEIIAVGVRPAGGGPIQLQETPRPGEPTMRFAGRASSIDEIEQELTRIWSMPNLVATVGGEPGRHVAARTSVLNLVVVTRRPEIGERCAAIIARLTGRHPSRTLVVVSADPDGPSWLDARIQAHCVLPREDAPETCAELIFATAGGETGRHLRALVAPLVIHDLPVMVWWPDEPPLGSAPAEELLSGADRLVVDGATWSGDGLGRLGQLAGLYDRFPGLSIRDFALVRQSRWREAIASTFDNPEFLPYLPYLRRLSVAYATHDETGAVGSTNIIKPVYHVAWLAARLGLRVVQPLTPADGRGAGRHAGRPGAAPAMSRGLAARLAGEHGEVTVLVRPLLSQMPSGTTLRVELLAERRGSELRADVTAHAENVRVHVWLDGIETLVRTFHAPRRTDVDLLGEAIELGGRDPIAVGSIRLAAALAGVAPDPADAPTQQEDGA